MRVLIALLTLCLACGCNSKRAESPSAHWDLLNLIAYDLLGEGYEPKIGFGGLHPRYGYSVFSSDDQFINYFIENSSSDVSEDNLRELAEAYLNQNSLDSNPQILPPEKVTTNKLNIRIIPASSVMDEGLWNEYEISDILRLSNYGHLKVDDKEYILVFASHEASNPSDSKGGYFYGLWRLINSEKYSIFFKKKLWHSQ